MKRISKIGVLLALGFILSSGAVRAEVPQASTPVDALQELNKLPEGDILLIEYCLGVLKYYPNHMTGKASQQLVDAIKQYQQNQRGIKISGYLTNDDQFQYLMERARAMSIGNLLVPAAPNSIRLVDGGNTAEIYGIWIKEEGVKEGSFYHAEHIVCHKDSMRCTSAFTMGQAGSDTGISHYSIYVYEYEVQQFNDHRITAKLRDVYNNVYDSAKTHEPICSERLLTINLAEQKARVEMYVPQENSGRLECRNDPNNKKTTYVLGGGFKDLILGRYAEFEKMIARTIGGEKEQMLKMVKAIEDKIDRHYK